MEVLGARVHGGTGDSRSRGDDEMCAALLHLGWYDPHPWDGKGGDVVPTIGGMPGLACPRSSAETIHCDVRPAQARAPDALGQDGPDLVVALRRIEAKRSHR